MKLKIPILVLGIVVVAVPLVAIERRFGFTPTSMVLVLLTLIVAIIVAIKLSLNVRWMRKLVLHAFSGERASLSCDFGSGAIATMVIFAMGAFLGTTVYVDRTNAFYKDLSSAYCRADVLSDVFATENAGMWPALREEVRTSPDPCSVPRGKSPGRLDAKLVYKLIKHFNLLDPDETSEEAFIQASQPLNGGARGPDSTNRNAKIASIIGSNDFKFTAGDPTINLVLALAAGLKGATTHTCADESDSVQRTALASALAQQPYPALILDGDELKRLQTKPSFAVFAREPVGRIMQRLNEPGVADDGATTSCTPEDVKRKTAGIANHLSRWSSFTFERPSPELTAQEIAGLAVKWHEELPDQEAGSTGVAEAQNDAVLRFMAVLLSEMRGTEGVRAERRYVNALVGYERCAVIILAFVFVIFLVARFIQRLPHDIHQSEIASAMLSFQEKWCPGNGTGRVAANIREQDGRELLNGLLNGYLADEKVTREAKKKIVTLPLRILGAALDEMELIHKSSGNHKPESNFVETLSDGERRSLDGSRIVFDTLLPTFPAIGFVGTVSSLLIAMSEADRIVRTDEALARGIAASQVTDILSLCFSTTLLALLCVLVFSPLSMMQAARERRLIDETEYQVQTVLRPEQP